MCYIKAGIIWRNEFYGFKLSEDLLCLDARKQLVLKKPTGKNFAIIEIPPTVQTMEEYASWVKDIKKEGRYFIFEREITRERYELGIPALITEKNKKKLFDYFQKSNKKDSDDEWWGDYQYACIVDLDNNTFYSVINNPYGPYKYFLPTGWKYEEYLLAEI